MARLVSRVPCVTRVTKRLTLLPTMNPFHFRFAICCISLIAFLVIGPAMMRPHGRSSHHRRVGLTSSKDVASIPLPTAMLCCLWTTTLRVAVVSSSVTPWWDDASFVSPLEWKSVDPDFSWNQRQTGIVPEWRACFGQWQHCNDTALNKSSSSTTMMDSHFPVPWTQGLMCKFLRQQNSASFELCSLCEPEAAGLWMQEGMPTRPNDGLLQNKCTFRQTPFRVTQLPFLQLPSGFPDAARQSRVTVVQPMAATFSGMRWLPTCLELQTLIQEASQAAVRVVHFYFCEIWLGETVQQRDSDPPLEGRKVGFFCQYDTITGKIQLQYSMIRRGTCR